MRYLTVEEILERLKESHPDKMVLDDGDGFTRGRLVGHIDIILEIEAMLNEEEEDG